MTGAGNHGTAPPGDGERLGLTEASLLALEYYPPDAALQPYVTTFYSLRTNETEVRDVLPAGVGYLQFFLTGSGTLEFPDGHRDGPFRATLITPSSVAAIANVFGPSFTIGAALSPIGWAALIGLAADKHRDRIYDGAEHLGPDVTALAASLAAAHAAGTAPGELAERLGAFIAARLQPLNSRHLQLIGHVADWLSSAFDPPLADLERRAAYSGRQLQRLVERYFGLPPKALVRKYRALRVAALLQDAKTSDERVAELLDLFYDQSHLIRELRHFLGRTPARLTKGGDALLAAASGVRNYREVRPNFARMPED